jgi:glycosyltransferase involved in cell wall biosynthesis
MKILIVNYRYFVSGGPEKYMFNIKKILEEKGHEVSFFSVKSNKNEKTKYEKYFVNAIGGNDAVYYDELRKTPKVIWQLLNRSIYSNEVKKALKKEIKEVNPDIVYIIHFVNKLSPSVISAAKEMNKPVVLRLSDYFLLCPRFDFLYNKKVCEDCLKCGYRTCIKRKCVKNSKFASIIRVFSMKIHKIIHIYDKIDAFVTPSNFLRKKLVENGYDGDKINCIPTFTNNEFKNENNKLGEYGLYFGRISEEKGVETLVKAYKEIPNYKLKIMGDDTTDEAIRLKEYINKNNMKNIEFLGFKKGEELDDIIDNARFTIIPSIWYDNLPNTALESFIHSKPVIASNIGSLPELVKDKYNGYLFEPGNEKSLVEKIKLLDNDDLLLEMGKNSFSQLKDKFSTEKHYESLIELFNNVQKKNINNKR